MDEGNVYIRITMPYSISLNKTHDVAKKVRDELIQFPEAKSVAVRVGRPEDIAAAVLFLAVDKAGFITGQNLVVDGGMTGLMIYHGDGGWAFTPAG